MNNPVAPDSAFLKPEYHELVGLVYDSITSPQGFYPFLKRFIDVFQAHSASFSIYDTRVQTMIGAWVVNIPEHALEFYAKHIAHQDALIETARAVAEREGPRFVASNLDFGENRSRIRQNTRAGEWLESYGAHEACGATALQEDSYLNFFGIQRARHHPDFTRQELAIFDLFLPHISRAVGLYTKMSAASPGVTPERLALNHVQRGILVCDASFRIAFKNATADGIIQSNRDLHLTQDRLLLFRNKAFGQRFSIDLSLAVCASMARRESEERVLCYRRGTQNITLVISPLAAADGGNESGIHRGGAMISLYDWSARPKVEPQLLQHFFALTEAEARVAALLVEGQSPTEIAQELSRSRETIKSHLKSVFRKTNTARQGELVALLSSGAALN